MKILILVSFKFDFCSLSFLKNIFILVFYFYYMKINLFHKNENIINFYKLFIKKYSNYYYLYVNLPLTCPGYKKETHTR